MTASVMRFSPAAALSVPRIGAWSASLTIHLAIIALLLSAPAAIRFVQYVKPDVPVMVHIIEPVKKVEVPPAPVPIAHHTSPAPAIPRQTVVARSVPAPIPIDVTDVPTAIPAQPIGAIGTDVSTDVAPSALGYGSKTNVPYPIDAARMREQGTVILRVLVGADGKVLTVEIETSSGSSRLDRAAREAVKTWLFNPARHGGVATSAWAKVPISFNLSTL
ncbi:MAG: energy transducer TonB [Rudaea sp.]